MTSGWQPDTNGHFFHLARQARDHGYLPLVPIMPGKKGCFVKDWPRWRNKPPTNEEIRGWIKDNPRLGFGYAHDHQLVGFDIDVTDENLVYERLQWLERNIWHEQNENPPMYRIGNAPKILVVFRADPSAFSVNSYPEIYCNHGQTVFFGIHPDTNSPYRWQHGSPATRDILDLPYCTGTHIRQFMYTFSSSKDFIARRAGYTAVHAFLSFAQDHKIAVTEPDSYVKVIAASHEGNRHHILKAAIAHALNEKMSRNVIERMMRQPYIELFRNETYSIQRRRIKDFDEVLEWALRKVPAAQRRN